MLARPRQMLKWLVLAGYLLAITVIPALHQHASHGPACGEHAAAGRSGPRAILEYSAKSLAGQIAGADDDEDNDCPLCKFLGQQYTPIAACGGTATARLFAKLLPPEPEQFLSRTPLAEQSRGPPLV